jgi:hypothetical protein
MANILWNFELGAVQNYVNLADLEKCCKMSIHLRRSVLIRPRIGFRKIQTYPPSLHHSIHFWNRGEIDRSSHTSTKSDEGSVTSVEPWHSGVPMCQLLLFPILLREFSRWQSLVHLVFILRPRNTLQQYVWYETIVCTYKQKMRKCELKITLGFTDWEWREKVVKQIVKKNTGVTLGASTVMNERVVVTVTGVGWKKSGATSEVHD